MKYTKHCAGCYNDFYNGHNPYGVKKCCSLASAVLVKALDVPIHLRPPYTTLKLANRPNCYKAQGFVRVKPENLTPEGYWK